MVNEMKHSRTSDVLSALIVSTTGEGDISMREVLHLLGERVFGLAILVFSLPNSLPIPSPPGFSAITGIPIILLSLQMIMGRKTFWLPERIANYQFSRAKFVHFLVKALPLIRKFERLMHPRLLFMQSRGAECVIGGAFLLLAIVLSLPIPFGNFLPGLAMSVIALGMLERDGALIIGGIVFGVGGIGVVSFALGKMILVTIGKFLLIY